jgi:hypothetical protein
MDHTVLGKHIAIRPHIYGELLALKHSDNTLSSISAGFRLGNAVKGILQ